VLPPASRAVTVRTLVPACKVTPAAVQLAVPVAVPEPPRLFAHVTCVTPTSSAAVPCRTSDPLPVLYAALAVGDVIATVGFVVSDPVPLPVTIRDMDPPFALKLIVALTVVAVVGVKRTVTIWVVPAPLSVNGLPDTTLNGAVPDAAPETVPPPVFDTVKACSAKLPGGTVPKFTVPVGLTPKSLRAAALAEGEHAL
jgi:hypothetical protein